MSQNKSTLNFLFGFVLVFMLSWGTPSIYAQQMSTGTLLGTVTDSTGAVLPGVEVTLIHLDTGATRLAVTGDEGRYRAPQLSVGNYEIRAELAGFQTAVRRGLSLQVGQEAVVDLSLQIGEISQEVVVTGEAPLLNTTTASLSEVINEQQVHELPLNSRDLIELTLLTPGVVQVVTSRSGGVTSSPNKVKVSIGGARLNMTGYLLDGTDITETSRSLGAGGAAGALFGVETVKELRVITNNLSAQYSRFAGGVVTMVTKSGTNDFHGSAFWFHRNDNLDARKFFDVDPSNPTVRSSPPEFKRHQFGGTIGGPIAEDTAFFFFSYEGFREGLGESLRATVFNDNTRAGLLPINLLSGPCPPADVRPGGLCDIGVDPKIQPFMDLYPVANGADLGNGVADFFIAKTAPTNEDFITARIDHTFSDSDSFFGRYTISDGERIAVDALPATGFTGVSRNQYLTLEEKHILSPTMINTFRVGFQRSRWVQIPPPGTPENLSVSIKDDEPFGNIRPGGGVTGIGVSLFGQNVTNMFSYTDDLFITRGRHDLKVGFAAVRYQNNDLVSGTFGGRQTFSSLEGWLTATPSVYRGALPGSSSLRGFREWVFAAYLQDDFKFTPNLTVNLGVRYEAITTPYEVNGRQANLIDLFNGTENIATSDPYFKNPSLRNFAPRIGLAWDPFGDGKTSVRAGFGVFHDTILFYHYANQGRRNAPWNVTIDITNPTFPIPTDEEIGGGTPRTSQALPTEFEPNQPFMMNWNLTLQREVVHTTFTASYVGSRGTHLIGERMINTAVGVICPAAPCPAGSPDGVQYFASGLPRRNLNFADIRYWSFASSSFYHGLQLSARQRLTGGLQFQASYTFGRSIDDSSRVNTGDISGAVKIPQDPYDLQGSNRGLSGFHVKNAFRFNFAYDLPFSGSRIAEGWRLNGIISLQDGPTLAVAKGSTPRDWNRDRNNSDERISVLPGGDHNLVLADGRDPRRYFDPTQFFLQDRGFYGNLGRNTLIGPGTATTDLSVMKNTPLSEQVNMQFRVEFFNIFNRANFGTPSLNVCAGPDASSPNGCIIASNAGRISTVRTSAREIQLGLRLVF